MRLIQALILMGLAGCAASLPAFETRLGQKFIGKPVDQMIVAFGPPKRSAPLNGNKNSYEWDVAQQQVEGTVDSCRIRAIASQGVIETVSVDRSSSIFKLYCEQNVALN